MVYCLWHLLQAVQQINTLEIKPEIAHIMPCSWSLLSWIKFGSTVLCKSITYNAVAPYQCDFCLLINFLVVNSRLSIEMEEK